MREKSPQTQHERELLIELLFFLLDSKLRSLHWLSGSLRGCLFIEPSACRHTCFHLLQHGSLSAHCCMHAGSQLFRIFWVQLRQPSLLLHLTRLVYEFICLNESKCMKQSNESHMSGLNRSSTEPRKWVSLGQVA